jgi:DNA-directed RNA polymerase specialized sigma24 family protein
MASEGSVTGWLGQLQVGEESAVQKLWERYFDQLVRLARKKLQKAPCRMADEEDVALSAFNSFCRQAERGRFPQLQDRHNLWQLLVVLTARKASHLMRDETRQKRGGGQVPVALDAVGFEQIVHSEPTPAFAAEIAEECQRLLGQLGDQDLERIAVWKMEGWTSEEIAEKLSCAPRTVERKLRLIRSIWEKVLPS